MGFITEGLEQIYQDGFDDEIEAWLLNWPNLSENPFILGSREWRMYEKGVEAGRKECRKKHGRQN